MIRHGKIHDLTTNLLSEVCWDVGVEPALQPLDREPLQCATVNWEDGARLDVVDQDFWGQNWQHVFFDIRVFNPLHTPILILHCLDAMLRMCKKSIVLMMSVFVRWRELVFPH